jgi:hypothetical protein
VNDDERLEEKSYEEGGEEKRSEILGEASYEEEKLDLFFTKRRTDN